MQVPLGNGCVALVDEADWEMVARHRWHVATGGHGNRYARSSKAGYMHRMIVRAPSNMEVDHINGDGLDNRRCNLRVATVAENHRNRRKPYGSSRFLGVSKCRNDRWRAQIKADGRVVHLGTFRDEVEAAVAYDRAAIRIHGEFAAPNFPELVDV